MIEMKIGHRQNRDEERRR